MDEEREPYYMKFLNKAGLEIAQLKCSELHPLKRLRDQIVSWESNKLDVTFTLFIARSKTAIGKLGLALDDRTSRRTHGVLP